MLEFIEKVLCHFESCFTRKAAYSWFVAIVIGLMLRSDQLGVTSIVRDLALSPGSYDSMLHFFRATSWTLKSIREHWYSAVNAYAPLYTEQEMHVLAGDGVKQSKEGRRMPGVKKLHQESENSAKPEYIHGHMFGGLGILAGNTGKRACIPLSIRLHDGLQGASGWEGASISSASHVVQMIEDAYHATAVFGDSLLLLDRYFRTVPALERLKSLNNSGDTRLEIITRAKKSCVAFEAPAPKKPGRGRPPKKGAAVHLKECFSSRQEQFQNAQIDLYGKQQTIRYYTVDLLWGQKLYQPLRFVLVERNGVQSILASTCLQLDPLSIIRLYSYRFRIECTFRELKQQIGAFSYHFWSKHLPKLSYFQKKSDPSPLHCMKDAKSRQKVLDTIRATEMHLTLSCIAMGILQCLSILWAEDIPSSHFRYLRTPSRSRVSEATLMHFFRLYFFRFLADSPHLRIVQIIQALPRNPLFSGDSLAS